MKQINQATRPLPSNSVPRLPAYPKYKDSRVEWLGMVPESWEVSRLKNSIDFERNGVWGNEACEDENDLICVRVADFDRVNFRVGMEKLTTRNVSVSEQNGRVLDQGDLLLEKSGGGDLQPVGFVVLFDHEFRAVCSNFVARIKTSANANSKFFVYVHAALYDSRLNVRSIKQTTGIQNLDSSSYFEEHVAFPSLPEQHAIASYLDRETARLDRLIGLQERLIELSLEKRRALIGHATTRGLDETAPLKDSGVEWLGMVPVGWEVAPLKHFAKFYGGGTPSKENLAFWNGDIPWVSPKDMKCDVITDSEDHITSAALESSASNLIDPGAVLIVVRSGILKHTIPVAINSVSVTLNQDMKAIVLNEKVLSEYFANFIRGMQKVLLFEWCKVGATVESIEHEYLANSVIPVPPLPEQHSIVQYLDAETARIDDLISKVRQAIALMKERRSAVIAAAVTGQIDCRGEACLAHNISRAADV